MPFKPGGKPPAGTCPAPAHEAHHAHHKIFDLGPPHDVDTEAICAWIFALVVFTLVFEHGLTRLHKALGDRNSPKNQVLTKVKDELMLMGLLSFGLSMFEQVVELSHEIVLSFEWAHTLLFMGAVVLVVAAIALMGIADALGRELHAMENAPTHELKRGEQLGETLLVGHTTVDVRKAAEFQAMRHTFLSEHTLPVGFDFSKYLHDALYEFVLEMLEVDEEDWSVVVVIIALNAARVMFAGHVAAALGGAQPLVVTSEGELAAFAAFGWLLLAVQAVLWHAAQAQYACVLQFTNIADLDKLHGVLTKLHAEREALDDTNGDDGDDADAPGAPHGGSPGSHSPLRKHSSSQNQHAVLCNALERPDAVCRITSTWLLVGCMYTAALAMRALGVAHAVGGTAGWVGAVAVALPVVLGAARLHTLVGLASLTHALTQANDELVDEVLEASFKAKQDADDFRQRFIQHFRRAERGKNMDDLRRVFAAYAAVEGAAGEPSLTSLSWRSPTSRRGLVSKTSRRLMNFNQPDGASDDEAEIQLDGMRRLVKEIYGGVRVPAERLNRLWSEMNSDLLGGISFDEFQSFILGRGKFGRKCRYAKQLFGEEAVLAGALNLSEAAAAAPKGGQFSI